MSWHPQSRDASSKNSSNHYLQILFSFFFFVDRKFNGEKSLELAAFVPAAAGISDEIGT